jgi:plastocyanin
VTRPLFFVIARRTPCAVAIQLALFGFALACGELVEPACATAAEVSFKLTDHTGAPVADAVASLVPLDAPVKISPPASSLEISQSGQEFSAYVTPVLVGTTVIFPNRDSVAHQVYSLSPAKKFTFPLYKPGAEPTVVFDQPGVIALGCNIHDWMSAYVVVLATPWFARTNADGAALIAAVPPGRYRAEIWHPRLAKTETRELTVVADAAPPPVALTLALKPDRRVRRAPAATGGGYK